MVALGRGAGLAGKGPGNARGGGPILCPEGGLRYTDGPRWPDPPPTVHLRSLPFWGSSLHRSSPKEKLETNLEPQRVTSKLRCSRVTGPEGCGSRLNASQRKVDW